MPVVILHTRSTIEEPAKDRKAQAKFWADLNDIVDEYEAKIAALGGVTETEHNTKRGAKAPAPPPAVPAAPEADMVTLAEVGAAVSEASKRRAA